MSTKKKYLNDILAWFQANMPEAKSELNYRNPYELLVAVMLSAQCTDKRVNMVTPTLFERFPGPAELAASTKDEIYGYIRSISYPNSKAEHLLAMAQKLTAEFGGQVPDDLEALQTLPGVGRKTANVIGAIIFDKPVIAVDTHVFRVSRRLGLSGGKNVLEVEKDLTAAIPADIRPKAHHWLLLHGRHVCKAQKPGCTGCGLTDYCRYYKNNKNNITK